ncbi:hypothetical protein GHT06_020676 [Daphnia sinensis]|uniref:Uncharacterized protein n=1 Tax=Daphnia sinensis TaxID=1820382 RepID=A0AAD5PM87_9CRUS|nr:hypothetical protein GHT06_020676 [Daphnia sinensis]
MRVVRRCRRLLQEPSSARRCCWPCLLFFVRQQGEGCAGSQMSITKFLMCFLAVVVAVAGESTGYRPAMAYPAPVYKAPAYQAPAYKAPAYKAPAYQPPAYKAPAYQPPAYQPPAPKAPAYMAPAPSYKAAAAY